MDFAESLRFEAPAARVLTMYTDRTYFERKYQRLGLEEIAVLSCENQDPKFRIRCRYRLAPEVPLPAFAQKLIGSRVTLVQEDRWDRATRQGQLFLEIPGAPLSVRADMSVADEGTGCIHRLHWHISCSLPVVGSKLEKLFAEDLRRKLRRDHDVSQQLLREFWTSSAIVPSVG